MEPDAKFSDYEYSTKGRVVGVDKLCEGLDGALSPPGRDGCEGQDTGKLPRCYLDGLRGLM